MVKSEAVSDILAREAGLSSPGTVSSLDWDEISSLYHYPDRMDATDVLPGADDSQRRINGCLLIRDRGEQMRSYAAQLSSYIDLAESMDFKALKTILSTEPIFKSGTPPEYVKLIEMLKDHEYRKGQYSQIREIVDYLKGSPEVTETGENVLDEFYVHIPQIELSDRLVDRSIQDATSDINREYSNLLENVDDKKMAASLLYHSAGIRGSNDLGEGLVQPFKFSRMDYVTNNVLEKTEYLNGMVAEKYFEGGEDVDTAMKAAVKEFIEE